MKKILITGGNGFIGKSLAEELENEYDIYTPDRQQLDLFDEGCVKQYLSKEKMDTVIHCANVNARKNKNVSSYDVLDGNLRMFFNLEKCSQYFNRMYYFGSGAEYDMRYYIPNMREEYLGEHIPLDPYGFSKYIMARAAQEHEKIYELVLFGVYGKYEEWDRRFITNNIYNNLTQNKMTLTQNCYFDYIDIKDLAKIMKWFLEHRPIYKRYHVCRGERIDLLTLAQMINHVLEKNCEIEMDRQGWKKEYTGNNERLMKEMGHYKFKPFEESIYTLVEEMKVLLNTSLV